MAAGVRPPTFQPFGEQGPTVYLSNDGTVPVGTDAQFRIGDWIVNTVPTGSGVHLWVVTAAVPGVSATFKVVATAA